MGSLNKFHPERLTVEYRDGVTATEPILSRKYTLTHSDDSAELFLTIGTKFAWDTINPSLRDEVLGEWISSGNFLYYNVYVFVSLKEHDFDVSMRRNKIFQRELPLALTAIRFGDRFLFDQHPYLNHAFILVNFISTYPPLARQENWGTFSNFQYMGN